MFIHGLYVHLTQQQPKAPHWEALKRTIPVPNLVKCCPLLEMRADCAEKNTAKAGPYHQFVLPQVDKQLPESDESERNQNL